MGRCRFLPLVILVVFTGGTVRAAEPAKETSGKVEKTVEDLRKEVDRLKARVKDLESHRDGKKAAAPAQPMEPTSKELKAAMDRIAAANVSAPLVRGLSIGGQVRLQAEENRNYDLDSHTSDSRDFVRQRVRLCFDFDVSDAVRIFAKFQDARLWGQEHSVAADIAGTDLKEGYVDFRSIPGVSLLRVGRQELQYGDGRLIAVLDWDTVTRAWDGALARFEGSGYRVDAFATRIDQRFLPDGKGESQDFYGIYSSFTPLENHVLDLYFLYRRNHVADSVVAEDGSTGREDLYTVGGRFKGKTDGLDYVVEIAGQFGDHAGDSIRAWMGETEIGYTFERAALTPRIGAGLTAASGDDDPTDGTHETFDPLYTFGHFYLGYTDRVGRKNILSPKLFVHLAPSPDLTLTLDWHYFRLMTAKDALYDAGGHVLRAGMAGADRYVGHEIDLAARWRPTKAIVLWGGVAHFFAGGFLEDTGAADDATLVFLQFTANF